VTTHTAPPVHVEPPTGEPPPPAAEETEGSWSIRHAAVTAGVGLLLMSVLAGLAKIVVLDGLVTPGDAPRTAADIAGANGLFRLGVLSLITVIVLDVVVAWGLYRVFSPVNRPLSLLAAAFRLVFAAVFLAAIGQLLGALRLLGDDAYLSVFSAEQLHAQALLGFTAFNDLWVVALGLFGVHLLLEGYLVYRSGYAPRLVGVLLVISGFGYVIDSVGTVLSPGPWSSVGAFTFIGEFVLALWLVIRGPRLVVGGSPVRSGATGSRGGAGDDERTTRTMRRV
jgi:hypothetical protein